MTNKENLKQSIKQAVVIFSLTSVGMLLNVLGVYMVLYRDKFKDIYEYFHIMKNRFDSVLIVVLLVSISVGFGYYMDNRRNISKIKSDR